ncbi:MAG TPA: hypothetical protein PKD00_05815 [Burkholderiales bacterium]|nr:hypothetical protein [Burkholderiales bacterium]
MIINRIIDFKRFNGVDIMKKKLLIACVVSGLIGCGSNSSPKYYDNKNVLEMPKATTISTRSMKNFSMPDDNQAIEELGSFKVRDNIYNSSGEQVIIPKHAVISGLYSNDGRNCSISWKSVYANEKNFNAKKVSFSIQDLTEDTACTPDVAIKKGNVVNVQFK